MLNDEMKERLRRLALDATPGPREMEPRDCNDADAVRAGEDRITVAQRCGYWLGWEVVDRKGFTVPPRGDFTGADAAFLMATPPEVILALLDEIDKLKEEKCSSN